MLACTRTLYKRAYCATWALYGAQINGEEGGGVNLIFSYHKRREFGEVKLGRGPREGMAHQSAFVGPELAYVGPKSASVGPESACVGPESASLGPKLASLGPKSASLGPRSAKLASVAPKLASVAPKLASVGSLQNWHL